MQNILDQYQSIAESNVITGLALFQTFQRMAAPALNIRQDRSRSTILPEKISGMLARIYVHIRWKWYFLAE